MPKFFFEYRYLATLIIFIVCLYYKFFFFGRIPFPADLLVASYLPWLDYYKIPVQNPLISDVFSQFFLWKHLSIDIIKNWQWPLWSPYSFTGTPLLATYHSATLYPLNVLLFLPKYFGWALYISSQTFIATLSMYVFLSLYSKNPLPKLIGSIIFSLGSLMTTWLQIGTAGHAITWLPLSLFFAEKYIRALKIRYLLFLIGALSLTILAGNAQITTYSIILVICYSFILSPLRSLPILLSIAFSLTLTALQLLPSFDLLNKSIRPSENYIQESNYGLLPLKEAFKFFLADFFGNPVTRNYWGNLNYLEVSGFVGTISLPLLIYAYVFLPKKDPKKIFFLTLVPISLVLIFDNPFSRFVYQSKIPLLTSSYASRALFIFLLGVSIISSITAEDIKKNGNVDKIGKTISWSWGVISGIFLGIILSRQLIQNSQLNAQFINNLDVSIRNSILPFLLITTLLGLFAFVKFNKLKIKVNPVSLLLLGILLLLSFDLGRYFLKFNPFVSQELVFPKTPTLQFLQKQKGLFRVGREHAEVFPPNVWTAYNLHSLEGYDPLYLSQYGKFINFLNGGDIRTGSSSRYAELTNYHSPFIDTANVKYFIGILRDDNKNIGGDIINPAFLEAGHKAVFKNRSSVILENPNALNRAYFAKSINVKKKEEIEETVMSDKSFDPRKTVLLSDDVSIGEVSGKGNIKILSYTPNKVTLITETSTEELLVLADQYEEGWEAKIDGIDTKISRANLIFRAVKVPTGAHEIKFSYWPKSFDVGLKISLATIGVIFIISFIAIKKKKF